MKGKRYSTEEKVRILREADAGEQSDVTPPNQATLRVSLEPIKGTRL